MYDFPIDSKYSRAILQLTVEYAPYGSDMVYVWRSKTYLREDRWSPVVEIWLNGGFETAYEYELVMDDPKVALTIAYTCAKELYEAFKKICGGFSEINESKPTENTF